MKEHMLSDEWIVSYAAGALGEAHSVLVASHIAYHPVLQKKLVAAEDIGGALLENLPETDCSEDMLDAVLKDIAAPFSVPVLSTAPKKDTDLPLPLSDYIYDKSGHRPDSLMDIDWGFMGPGMKKHRLWKGPDGQCLWLLRARGGTVMPKHDHGGDEMTLVLKGAYHVGSQRFSVGELEYAEVTLLDHQPVIDEGEDCICLVVTEAPIKLHSFLGRLIQPLIGL
ncbi:ChrR family anti-sigma-E factor [Paremcibacter congregatus]|uniref:ChrR family anti-sigma-E factor n=1 Tax=Paremcibacter congregatus TaxID=2043170 RepID=UPI003A9545D3